MRQKEWDKVRATYLKGRQNFEGYYVCDDCRGWFKDISVDHIKRRGSHPELAAEESNLQLLCSKCHIKKDGGMRVKERRDEFN